MIRVQNLVPEPYPAESRDFQILCRLCDVIYNGIKFDSDSILAINDVRSIQGNLLPLLQTKLGFFSKMNFTDNELRTILSAFPYMVKNKGSITAIKSLINMCLKLSNVTGDFTISYSDSPTIINGIVIDAHTIIVGVNTILENLKILQEIAKYIVPAGFTLYVYFYKELSYSDRLELESKATLLYSSSNLNSNLRGSVDTYTDDLVDLLLGSVNVAWLNSIDNVPNTDFLGVYDSVENLPSGSVGCTAIANEDFYYYDTQWNKVTFLGTYKDLTHASLAVATDYDLVAVLNNNTHIVYYDGNSIVCRYRGLYKNTSSVPDAKPNDIINLNDSVTSYKIYRNGVWQDVEYKGYYAMTENQYDPSEFDTSVYSLVVINGANFYLYKNSTWNLFTESIYMLRKYFLPNE